MRYFRLLRTAPLFALLLCIISCNTPPESNKKDQPGENVPFAEENKGAESPGFAETRPENESRDELSVAFSRGSIELDFRKSYLASEAQIYTALYEGLFSYHPFTMEPVPAAAEKWVLSEDKKTWTFTIRENARYWNGDSLIAEDFRAAWISLLDPKRASPYSSLFDIIQGARDYRMGKETDPSGIGIRTEGAKTLIVVLDSPASFFPAMLCHHSFSPIHPNMVNMDDWSNVSPISSGPFYIVETDKDRLVMAKNPLYWDAGRVALNKLTILFTDNGDEAAALWNSGQARWISGEINLDALTDRSGILVNAMFATHYYFFRSEEKPWNDYRVRKALVLALPWEEIRQGHYLPAKTLIYPIPGYPDVAGLETTDTEKARELLSEAGYPKGLGIPELVIRLTPSEEAARIGGLMASTWMEELGIPVKVEVIPYDQYFRSMKSGNYAVGSSTWIGDFADPYTFLQMWRRDSNLNDAHYTDEEYEALMDKSMSEEGEARWATLAEAEKLLLDKGEVLPISYSPALNIIDINELENWFPNALDIHPFKYLAFRSYRPLPGVAMADFPGGNFF
jgi:peptide/nickel transport system substrate-binding protein/oligopeptide transport system substrate-binding protein